MLRMSNAILVRKLDIFPEIVPINFLECLATTVKKLGTYPETVKMKLEPTQKCFAIDAKKLGTWLETAKILKKQDLTLEAGVNRPIGRPSVGSAGGARGSWKPKTFGSGSNSMPLGPKKTAVE